MELYGVCDLYGGHRALGGRKDLNQAYMGALKSVPFLRIYFHSGGDSSEGEPLSSTSSIQNLEREVTLACRILRLLRWSLKQPTVIQFLHLSSETDIYLSRIKRQINYCTKFKCLMNFSTRLHLFGISYFF